MTAGNVVVVEGLPGAGKSTLCSMFAVQGAVVSQEVQDADGRSLSNEEINAADTRLFLMNDLHKYSRAREASLEGNLAVVDRGIYSTLAYSRLLDERNGTHRYLESRHFYSQYHEMFSCADIILYLDLPPTISANRKKPVIVENDLWSFPKNLEATRQYYLSTFCRRGDVLNLSGLDDPQINLGRVIEALRLRESDTT